MKGKNIAPQWGEDRAGEFVKQLRRRGVSGDLAQLAISEKGGIILDKLAAILCDHEHVFEPQFIRNPDPFFRAYRGDVLIGYGCTFCSVEQPSSGWDGSKRIRRNELCEVCDGPVEKTDGVEAQDLGRFQDPRTIYFYQCKNCEHSQYYFEK